MKAFVFKPTNELLGKFDFRSFDELATKLQQFLANTGTIPLNSYIEASGRTWTIVSQHPVQLADGRIIVDVGLEAETPTSTLLPAASHVRYTAPETLERPLSVTVISWMETLKATAVLVVVLFNFGDVLPDLQMFIMIFVFIDYPLQLAIAFGMLQGKNWARTLFFWLGPISWLFTLFSTERPDEDTFMALGVRMSWYAICVGFLTRPYVVDYFQRLSNAETRDNYIAPSVTGAAGEAAGEFAGEIQRFIQQHQAALLLLVGLVIAFVVGAFLYYQP